MAREASPAPLLVVDACVWINLFATGRIEEILGALPHRVAASRYVADEEVLTVVSPAAEAAGGVRRLHLGELERRGLLTLLDLGGAAESAELVRFAAELDDGEASTCALAVCRAGGVATDDRKALKVLARLAPQVMTVQTPQLLEAWAQAAAIPDAAMREVLTVVRDLARFQPRPDAPGFAWWSRILSRGST